MIAAFGNLLISSSDQLPPFSFIAYSKTSMSTSITDDDISSKQKYTRSGPVAPCATFISVKFEVELLKIWCILLSKKLTYCSEELPSSSRQPAPVLTEPPDMPILRWPRRIAWRRFSWSFCLVPRELDPPVLKSNVWKACSKLENSSWWLKKYCDVMLDGASPRDVGWSCSWTSLFRSPSSAALNVKVRWSLLLFLKATKASHHLPSHWGVGK